MVESVPIIVSDLVQILAALPQDHEVRGLSAYSGKLWATLYDGHESLLYEVETLAKTC